MNGSLDDGWSLKSDDSVTIAVNKSPNKFFVEGGGIICAKASIEIKVFPNQNKSMFKLVLEPLDFISLN